MRPMMFRLLTCALLTCALPMPLHAQEAAAPQPMQRLFHMKGLWKGEARGVGADRKPYQVLQTERVGAMLNGDVLVVEGRGYRPPQELAFNALGVLSFNASTQQYEMRAYADGKSATFPVTVADDQLMWEKPAGPKGVVRYTLRISGDRWHETGELILEGQPARPIFEMNLQRISDTDWPAGNPVLP